VIIYRNNYQLAGKKRMLEVGRWQIVQEIYNGARLVWTAIRSCFGAGYWINDKPWLNDEPWKN
jgi:hypothetical protein